MEGIVSEIVVKLSPVFLLIGTGVGVRRLKLFSPETIDGFKKLIINISLPAILFFAFLEIDLQVSYLAVFVLVFGFCCVLYALGFVFKKVLRLHNRYVPFLSTGFEFGMMGAVLFGAAFGMENIKFIGLIGLGHEIFIWFVYVTLLKIAAEGSSNPVETLRGFLTSPVIIAILLGVICNLLGLKGFLEGFVVSKALFRSLQYLAGLTVPLILIIIGYNLRFEPGLLKKGIPLILARMAVILLFVFLVDTFVFRMLFQFHPLLSAALFIFFILPPPFILPLFIKKQEEHELASVNGILLLYTMVSIIAFSVYFIVYTATVPAG
jgi:malate permease and related proteins